MEEWGLQSWNEDVDKDVSWLCLAGEGVALCQGTRRVVDSTLETGDKDVRGVCTSKLVSFGCFSQSFTFHCFLCFLDTVLIPCLVYQSRGIKRFLKPRP